MIYIQLTRMATIICENCGEIRKQTKDSISCKCGIWKKGKSKLRVRKYV